MAHPLDFNDGCPPCNECGVSVPAEEARAVLQLRYKENVDYEGQTEHSRRQLVVCPHCYRRLMRQEWVRDLKDRLGMALAVVFAVGVPALIVYVVLVATRVL